MCLSKIPLIGQLLSGGKHEGLFGMSFTIKGTRQDPQTSVNPLSALTPGFLRKIFQENPAEMTLEENDTPGEDDADMNCDIPVEKEEGSSHP